MKELLSVQDLRIHFHNAAPERNAVDGVSFSIYEGEILGLVGESGSGKTVTAMTISGLLPRKGVTATGIVSLDGTNLLELTEKQMLDLQGDDIAVVFQEPMTSMNPTMKIGPQVEECLRVHTKLSKKERKAKALKVLADVDLPDPEGVYEKYPHELSGGMLQRVMIAAAIVSEPRVLLADEPTTALDVTVQGQILELLKKLNRENGTTILFISHNLHVIRKLCNRVAVMQGGHVVEEGPVDEVFFHPQHEYTKKLIAAIPTRERKIVR